MTDRSWMTWPLKTAALALIAFSLTTALGCGRATEDDDVEGDGVPVPELTEQEKAELAAFREPEVSAEQENGILNRYGHLDPEHLVPRNLLKKALSYFETNRALLGNDSVLTIIDFSAKSTRSRMYVIDIHEGSVTAYHMAHGRGSDPRDTGYAKVFSNRLGSRKSSLGYYRTAETYISPKHGLALRMDGLSSTNSNVRKRAIVVHGATYVLDRDIKQGRSSGCFAVSDALHEKVVNRLKKGSLIYAGRSGISE